MPCIGPEDLVRAHLSDCRRKTRVHQVDDLPTPDDIHQRDYHQPHQETSAADDEGVLQTDNIAQTEDCGPGVDLQQELRLVGYCLAD